MKRISTTLRRAGWIFAAVLACFTVPSHAALNPEPPVQGIDYSRITYSWTDADNRRHTSTLADKADTYEQIVALLKEVYVNPEVPGFIRDSAYDLPGAITDSSRDPVVKYAPCTQAPYNMAADMEVQTPVEGATALLVEMRDDYDNSQAKTAEQMLRGIKSLQVLTQQLYIGEKDGSTNPGYLFNYVGELNSFFIITKGCNRVPDRYGVGVAPFYMMYEEFSPSNVEPIYGAYDQMNSGEQFSVNHNCSSVLGQNHLISMSEENSNEHHQVNILFYLPDWRFAGDSRRHDGEDRQYEWYTFYDNSHQPFVFFSKIYAAINENPVADQEKMTADVKVEWKSTYKEVSKSNVEERFLVYRVINDVIQPEPVPADEFRIADGFDDTYKIEDGSIVSKDETCAIVVTEPLHSIAYNVRYIVKGRRWGSSFEYTESNIVETTLPSFIPSAGLSLRIGGAGVSRYDVAQEKNNYENPIELMERAGGDGSFLHRKHVRLLPDGTSPLFVLYRSRLDENGNPTLPDKVAEMRVVSEEIQEQYKQYLYTARIDYADGRVSTAKFKSARKDIDPSLYDEAPVTALEANKGVLAHFVDIFDADTSRGEQTRNYGYYMQYFDNEASPAADADPEKETYSNMITVNVPVRELKVGFVPYTDAEIAADRDADALLAPNRAVVRIEARSNPAIREYVVTEPENGNRVVAKVVRTATGGFQLSSAKDAGNLVDAGAMAYDEVNKPVIELMLDIPAGNALSLELRYADGNTYGNRRVMMPRFPRVEVAEAMIRKTGIDNPAQGLYGYGTYIRWNAADLESDLRTSDYQVHGYRAWVRNAAEGDFEQKFGLQGDRDVTGKPLSSGGGSAADLMQVFQSHKAEPGNPVIVDHKVRMYAVIPEASRVYSGNPDSDAYIGVTDTGHRLVAEDDGSIEVGVESPIVSAEDDEYIYYDLAGRRVDASELTRGVYIRVGGGKSEKVVI